MWTDRKVLVGVISTHQIQVPIQIQVPGCQATPFTYYLRLKVLLSLCARGCDRFSSSLSSLSPDLTQPRTPSPVCPCSYNSWGTFSPARSRGGWSSLMRGSYSPAPVRRRRLARARRRRGTVITRLRASGFLGHCSR